MYVLVKVAPTGTMTCAWTTNYMQAVEEDLPPGYFAFVVKVESSQVRHNHQTPESPIPTVILDPGYIEKG